MDQHEDGGTRGTARARVMPHNLQAEESLLGAMLLSPTALADAFELVSADHFYKPAHGHVFDAIQSVYSAGQPVDPVTVAEELRRAGLLDAIGGSQVLVDLQAAVPATSNAARYAGIVKEHAILRRLIGVAGEIAELAYDVPEDITKVVDRAESLVFEVAEDRITDTQSHIRALLEENLVRLEQLYERDEAITGIPTGYVDLDELLSGLQPSALIVVGARPAMGKCVSYDTLLVDPQTGERRTAAEVHRLGTSGAPVQVLTLGLDGCVRRAAPSAYVDDGVKPVYRVRTRTGRSVSVTASHPFLTPSGWRPLYDLEVGSSIGVPTRLPVFGRAGDGHPLGADLAELAGALADRRPHGHDDLLLRWGLPTDVTQRRVPSAVFCLARGPLAEFLTAILRAAGSWWSGPAGRRFVVSHPSARLLGDLQHLLLRFGCVSERRDAVSTGLAGAPQVHELHVVDDVGLAVLDELGLEGSTTTGAGGRRGPEAVAEPRASLARRSGGHGSMVAAGRAAVLTAPAGAVRAVDSPEVLWDEIVAIEARGSLAVYDLTVPVSHNFVADDVFVHNTSFALGMAAHAAMEANRPILFFSLEMSQLELTQRMLCAEARVDATKMRTGRLSESDWSKIGHAVGRLAEAPIWIDDNPNLTVMEIRAKARRLKSKVGDLGLIVVDYLQLMTGRSAAESRQVELAEISRGLKILARELSVPVVALAQLNRGLETRADKRPMLSDLRESGALEQDADVVLFLYRDEVYNQESPHIGEAEVITAKHRAGPTGVVRLAFLPHYTRFANMARDI